jgi:hypothetical protein
MPGFRSRVCSALLALACCSGAAHAAPFGIFDPRSLAMGGTGVSSGGSGSASYFNPALLAAARPNDRFSFEIMAAARAYDPDKLRDDIDTLDSSGQNLTNAISQFNQAPPSAANAAQLASALGSFQNALRTASNKTAEANLCASPLTVGVPGKALGWAVSAAARADIGVKGVFEASDDTLLTNYQTAAQNYANTPNATTLAALIAVGDTNGDGTLDDPNLLSHVDVRGAGFVEYGVSLAHEFESLGKLAIGITPKYVRVYTLDYRASAQNPEISADQGRKDYTSSNLDVGLAQDLGAGFRWGLVGKNVIARDYDTVLGNRIEVRPQVRAGLSHHTDWTTFAIDVDLTENQAVSFDLPTRYAAVGAEFSLWGFLALRAGYRGDLSGNHGGIPSLGLGLSLFGVHLDLAVARQGEKEAMAAAQLGFRF